MTAIGERRWRVAFERATRTRSTGGVEKEGPWTEICKAWVGIIYGSGQERRNAAALASSQVATFNALSNPVTRTVTTKDRINFDDLLWDITSIARVDRAEIQFTATTGKG